MTVYLSTPGSQMHAHLLSGMPVLLSFGARGDRRWHGRYARSYSRILLDSGAYSELNSGVKVDLSEYADWASGYAWADGVAALDDIRGDWQRGMENWRKYPEMFPTYHDSDPPEALDAILSYAPTWIGLGMVPPRRAARWLDETLERIPPGIHVHGWALRTYADRSRFDSLDSTDWMLSARKLNGQLPWLTPAECVELIVKRYQRQGRRVASEDSFQGSLF